MPLTVLIYVRDSSCSQIIMAVKVGLVGTGRMPAECRDLCVHSPFSESAAELSALAEASGPSTHVEAFRPQIIPTAW